MRKSVATTASSRAASAGAVELTHEMLDRVSGGNDGIGQMMGAALQGAGGMPSLMASMGKTPGVEMGNMLETAGGMKSAMAMGDMG